MNNYRIYLADLACARWHSIFPSENQNTQKCSSNASLFTVYHRAKPLFLKAGTIMSYLRKNNTITLLDLHAGVRVKTCTLRTKIRDIYCHCVPQHDNSRQQEWRAKSTKHVGPCRNKWLQKLLQIQQPASGIDKDVTSLRTLFNLPHPYPTAWCKLSRRI